MYSSRLCLCLTLGADSASRRAYSAWFARARLNSTSDHWQLISPLKSPAILSFDTMKRRCSTLQDFVMCSALICGTTKLVQAKRLFFQSSAPRFPTAISSTPLPQRDIISKNARCSKTKVGIQEPRIRRVSIRRYGRWAMLTIRKGSREQLRVRIRMQTRWRRMRECRCARKPPWYVLKNDSYKQT